MVLRFDEIFSPLFYCDLPSFKAICGQESCNTSMVLSPEDQPVDSVAMSFLYFTKCIQNSKIIDFLVCFGYHKKASKINIHCQ